MLSSTNSPTSSVISNSSTTAAAVESGWSYYVNAIWITVIFTVSFAANALAAYNVRASPSLRNPSMHVLCAGFLGNCACVLTAALPNLVSAWTAGEWVFPMWLCYLHVFSTSSLGLFNINLLTGLSVLRCRMVTRNRPFTHREATTLICLAALFGLLWSVPPMIGVAGVRRVSHVAACDLDWESGRPADRAYLFALLAGEFVLPSAIILVSYAAIYMHMRAHRTSALLPNSDSQSRRDRKFVIHVLAIIVTFLICWTPYAVTAAHSLVAPIQLDGGYYRLLSSVTLLMAKSGMAASALVYFAVNDEFRSALAATALGRRFRLPGSSSGQSTIGQQVDAVTMRQVKRNAWSSTEKANNSMENQPLKGTDC